MKCRPIFLLALLSLAHIVALASPDGSVKKRDLVVWGETLGPDTKGQDEMNREFSRRHPDVNLRALSFGAGKMDPQKLMTSIVGNVAPDVISQDRFTISDWASRGAFRSLDDLIARDQGSDPLCPRKEQYYPATWAEASYEGRVYGIPSGADDRILYYNKAIFREKAADLRAAGLDPDRPPRTWSELLAYSKVLTEFSQDHTLKRAGYLPNFGNSWLYLYAFQNDASFMSADGRRCTMDTPAAEEALEFMLKGYEIEGGYEVAKSYESGFLAKENDPFLIGKVAMKVDGSWILDDMSRFAPDLDFGVAPPPSPDDRYYRRGRFAHSKDQFVTWVGGFSFAIPKGAKNLSDGWEYIKFVTSTEGRMIGAAAQREWDRSKGKTYIPDVSASIAANEVAFKRFKPADPKFAAALKEHIDMMPFGRIRPATFAGQVLWDEQTRAMEAALYKKATPKQALISGQNAVQLALDAFYEKEQHPIIDLEVPARIGIGLTILGLVAATIVFLRKKMGRLERSEALWAYLFISPWLIGFIGLTLGPMLASMFFSFTQYDVLEPPRWVGLQNYFQMFGADHELVMKSLNNAIYLAALGVPLGLSTGLAIALLLNCAARGMRYYRTFFYMPAIVPTIASAVLWIWVLTPDADKGLINSYWIHTLTPWMGLAPPGWLQSADWSKNALILQGVWGAGGGMILWLAGLKGVPTSLYEASGIDGASPRQQFWSITFPQLSPIVFFNLVMGFIGAMQEFDRAYTMKPSGDGPIGPDDTLLTPVYHLFQEGFAFFKMGYASSLAWLIFGIILLLTYTQFKLAPRWVHYEADK
jgi:ABC-type sugar transport system permease subunit/ABC-type glycerol-3-phosphate transport system substrate-binding protein